MNPPTPITNGKLYRIFVANGNMLATALNAPVFEIAAYTFASCAEMNTVTTKLRMLTGRKTGVVRSVKQGRSR